MQILWLHLLLTCCFLWDSQKSWRIILYFVYDFFGSIGTSWCLRIGQGLPSLMNWWEFHILQSFPHLPYVFWTPHLQPFPIFLNSLPKHAQLVMLDECDTHSRNHHHLLFLCLFFHINRSVQTFGQLVGLKRRLQRAEAAFAILMCLFGRLRWNQKKSYQSVPTSFFCHLWFWWCLFHYIHRQVGHSIDHKMLWSHHQDLSMMCADVKYVET